MAHRRLILRERVTAIIGSAILFVLVAASYYYSIQVEIAGLKYIPGESSPDFTAHNVTLTDFDETGTADRRLFAEDVAHFSDERMRAQAVRFVTLDPSELQLALSAREAWSDDGLETVDLSGAVTLTRAAGPQEPDLFLQTEAVKGYLDTYRFESVLPVFMRRGNDTTEAAKGMVYDNVGHTLELRDRVRTVLHPQNFQQPTELRP